MRGERRRKKRGDEGEGGDIGEARRKEEKKGVERKIKLGRRREE